MSGLFRGILTLGSAVLGFLLTLWFVIDLLLPDETPLLLRFLLALAAGAGAGRFAWVRSSGAPPGLAAAVLTGGLGVGGVAFGAGFFGPMLLAPEANQGPLLGLFITGPIGFVVGAIGGAVYWARRRGRLSPEHSGRRSPGAPTV